jgi:hypothetical protein
MRTSGQKVSEYLVRPYCAEDQQAVIELWDRCGLLRPGNDPAQDITRKVDAHSKWFLVVVAQMSIVGSIMIGYEGHRGWINYLAVNTSIKGLDVV